MFSVIMSTGLPILLLETHVLNFVRGKMTGTISKNPLNMWLCWWERTVGRVGKEREARYISIPLLIEFMLIAEILKIFLKKLVSSLSP